MKNMDPLLKHMVDMTGHRDHAMLELSVVCAVQELAGAVQTRLLSVASVRGQQFVRARAMMSAGGLVRVDEADGPGDPLASYPELAQCLAESASSAEACGADGKRTLWLPIWCGPRADTCLEIVRAGAFPEATLHTIAGVVAVYRNFQNLLDYSERDSLTDLLNRKTFEDQLARMLQASADRYCLLPGQPDRRTPLVEATPWLAVVDVDNFKAVNDRFGHLYGDEVLILIADLLRSSFRAEDRVFRFGGEEFVVLLRPTSLENAHRIIERFRTGVEEHVFPQVGKVTVSIGYVSLNAYVSPVVTLGQADQALYYAKSHGRNQSCHYDALVANGALQAVASNDTAEFF
jgi:diguanylate cyclase (GGDEF)-like protein